MNDGLEDIDLQIKKFEQLEIRRKRNWFARYIVTLIIVITFLIFGYWETYFSPNFFERSRKNCLHHLR